MYNELPVYRVVVIGANGGIGKETVMQALNQGHQVTAVLRTPANLAVVHPNLQLVQGDIMQPDSFSWCLEGADVVVSAIGVKGGFGKDKPTTLYSQGNASLLEAMRSKAVTRVFVVSASAVEISPVLPWYIRLVEKYVVQRLLKHMYADLLRMEALVAASGMDFTILRPPQLNDAAVSGHYRYAVNAFLKNCLKISRADVAHFMLANIRNTATYQSTVEIGY